MKDDKKLKLIVPLAMTILYLIIILLVGRPPRP